MSRRGSQAREWSTGDRCRCGRLVTVLSSTVSVRAVICHSSCEAENRRPGGADVADVNLAVDERAIESQREHAPCGRADVHSDNVRALMAEAGGMAEALATGSSHDDGDLALDSITHSIARSYVVCGRSPPARAVVTSSSSRQWWHATRDRPAPHDSTAGRSSTHTSVR